MEELRRSSHFSIHDKRVLSHEVDGMRRRIVLQTRFDERLPAEHTDVVFDGALDYFFEDDSFANTLFAETRDRMRRQG